MPYVIDDARPDDAFSIGVLLDKSWLRTYPNRGAGITEDHIRSYSFSAPINVEKRHAWLTDLKDAKCLVMRAESRIVGVAIALSIFRESAELAALDVSEAYEGRGIGSRLLSGLIQACRARSLVVGVATYNERAICFYEKRGFKKSGVILEAGTWFLPGNLYIPEYEMVLGLEKSEPPT